MQTIRITTSQNIDISYDVAGPGERILAYVIDSGIFILVYLATLTIASPGFNASKIWGIGMVVLVCFLLYVFYDLLCEVFFNGQSIGKRVMQIRVISLSGSSPTLGQYLLRWMFRIVDFPLTSYVGGLISVIVSKNNQRIGDLVAGTTVIKTRSRTSAEHVAFIPPEENYEPVYTEVHQLQDKDVILIHEVLNNFKASGNYTLLYDTAKKVREVLSVSSKGMDDFSFLSTIVKDYNYWAAQV